MLINLSNHPSKSWSQSQMDEAKRLYSDVYDIPFPHIEPEWTIENVQALAIMYTNDIKLERPTAVHLMGELTFCFIVASLLKDSGIPCIASTTQRIVVENGDQKLSTFKFVQFRPYFIL